MLHLPALRTAGQCWGGGKEKSYERWNESSLEQEILVSLEPLFIVLLQSVYSHQPSVTWSDKKGWGRRGVSELLYRPERKRWATKLMKQAVVAFLTVRNLLGITIPMLIHYWYIPSQFAHPQPNTAQDQPDQKKTGKQEDPHSTWPNQALLRAHRHRNHKQPFYCSPARLDLGCTTRVSPPLGLDLREPTHGMCQTAQPVPCTGSAQLTSFSSSPVSLQLKQMGAAGGFLSQGTFLLSKTMLSRRWQSNVWTRTAEQTNQKYTENHGKNSKYFAVHSLYTK